MEPRDEFGWVPHSTVRIQVRTVDLVSENESSDNTDSLLGSLEAVGVSGRVPGRVDLRFVVIVSRSFLLDVGME